MNLEKIIKAAIKEVTSGFPNWEYPFDSRQPFDFLHRYGYGGRFIKYLVEAHPSKEEALAMEEEYVAQIRRHALSEGFPEDFVEKIVDLFKKSNDTTLRDKKAKKGK